MEAKTRSRVATGVMLIVLGLGLYGMQFVEGAGESVVLCLLGGLFVAGYLFTRGYALLVVGAIVFGLGIGSFGERELWFYGEFSKIGLGVGFVLIYVIQLLYERRSHWWPLIPGGVMLLLGFNAWRNFRLFLFSEGGWPLILVIVGGLILLGAFRRPRKK